MAYYIDKDGKTVHEYECSLGKIVLDDGTEISEADVEDFRLFAVHPNNNSLLFRDADGCWAYNGTSGPISLKETDVRHE